MQEVTLIRIFHAAGLRKQCKNDKLSVFTAIQPQYVKKKTILVFVYCVSMHYFFFVKFAFALSRRYKPIQHVGSHTIHIFHAAGLRKNRKNDILLIFTAIQSRHVKKYNSFCLYFFHKIVEDNQGNNSGPCEIRACLRIMSILIQIDYWVSFDNFITHKYSKIKLPGMVLIGKVSTCGPEKLPFESLRFTSDPPLLI